MLEAHVFEQARQKIVVAHHNVGFAWLDSLRMAKNQRHLHHEIVGSDGTCMVAHAKEAVLSSHPSLVARKDDDRILL